MLPTLGYILLLIAQVNPALTPHKAAKPALPKIDENACPFEGCQFGKWRAREAVPIYSTWKSDRKVLSTVRQGEGVTALTGVDITFAPGEIEVTAPIASYGLKPGDVVFAYQNLGEGFFNAWFKGYWVEDFDGSGVKYLNGSGCSRNCNAVERKTGRSEWWVKVKTRNGLVGWTKDGEQFDGKDALGPPD
ncbi:MAG TPA: hypothetical protein VFW25_04775 [Silvibacterium sp.]|nr:hypothetical protein [Silvibacterium sp.]